MSNPQEPSLEISRDVLAGIAGIAMEGVKGVVPAVPPVKVGEVLAGRRKGINVSRAGQSVTIDVSVNVRYGQSIPDVAREVQQAVCDNVELMTGLSVKAVNVTVQGILLPEAEAHD
ncbi:MAG TPA: Asp23/Gls24 family envelope stress response protein [Deinococcales bacterium]|nr:Asp23/Gls24 family envelope stress response protein [Deinococcales bacterium]